VPDGLLLGTKLGSKVGLELGATDGLVLGISVGDSLGVELDLLVGALLGSTDGLIVGTLLVVGLELGLRDGRALGLELGFGIHCEQVTGQNICIGLSLHKLFFPLALAQVTKIFLNLISPTVSSQHIPHVLGHKLPTSSMLHFFSYL